MKYFAIPLGLLALSVLPAHAGETGSVTTPAKVVELFTSQGCSSCPPANEFVTAIADDPDVLALSYGVTYWDYLGWEDTFGDPENTKRQRRYNAQLRYNGAYTPEIILNGVVHNSRFSERDVRAHSLKAKRPQLTLTPIDDDRAKITVSVPGEYQLSVVRFTPGPQQVPVKRGENGGRTLTITNVVNDYTVSTIDGTATVSLPATGSDHYAVIVQGQNEGPILTALRYDPAA